MGWHDDKQRREDAAQARAVKEQQRLARMKTARRMYEAGESIKAIGTATHTSEEMVKKWIADGGWKRDA